MQKLVVAIVMVTASVTENTSSQTLLRYLRDYRAAPRKAHRGQLSELLSEVCGVGDLRAKIPREMLPLLFPMQVLDEAVDVRCGEFILRDGRVIATGFEVANALTVQTPADEAALGASLSLRFTVLAGPSGPVP